MKTLVVYYSKTGTTQKVAESIVKLMECDVDALQFDEKTKEVTSTKNPSDYERIILLSPVWAFSIAEPMKKYIAQNKAGIKHYSLVVTCGKWGLRGSVGYCRATLAKPPEHALIFKAKDVKAGNFDISPLVNWGWPV